MSIIKTEQVEIPLSKGKLILLLIGSFLFVVSGFWFLISPPKNNNSFFGNPTFIFVSGIFSILFFGFLAYFAFKKLRSNKPGLVIGEIGITDYASGISARHIPWTDIIEIRTRQVLNHKFLMISIDNPNNYITQQKNPIIRIAAEINFKMYGTPISISTNTLQCNFEELENTLNSELNKSKYLNS